MLITIPIDLSDVNYDAPFPVSFKFVLYEWTPKVSIGMPSSFSKPSS